MSKTTPIFPKQASDLFSQRIERLLFLCYYDPAGISTVPETVACMQAFSSFSITVLNLFEHGRNSNTLSLSPRVNLDNFNGIIVHNSLSYNVDNLRSLDRLLERPLRKFMGVKVMMKQDENFRFKELARYIGETEYDIVFTCLPDQSIPSIYPEALVGTPHFSRMLTGYLTPTLRNIRAQGHARPIDIGYRGSIQPLSFGRLSYEKRKIGDDIQRLLDGRNLHLDISSRWEDRLGADDWLNFLASSKATLGAESGASVFDLNDDLAARCARAEARLGSFKVDSDYAEAYLSELTDLEGNINYNQVSPRHFEATATRTLQIMYPGRYSGIFIPWRHFVPLARDYSNLEEVVSVLVDETRRNEITDRAYGEIVESPTYWIETFVSRFDDLVSEALVKKKTALKPTWKTSSEKTNIILLAAHKPSLDPRLDWISKSAPTGMRIIQIGVLPPGSDLARTIATVDDNLVLAEPRIRFDPNMIGSWRPADDGNEAGWAGISEINLMNLAVGLDEGNYLEFVSAPADSNRAIAFKWYLNYILDTTATLMSIVQRVRSFGAIIATDLDTLPTALILKGLTGAPVIYDAHEYWPEADVAAFEFEKQYWVSMEKRLVKYADHRQTVSPGLANFMAEQYGCAFDVMPNCEPLRTAQTKPAKSQRQDNKCRFIYQGNFAPMRGLDLLIDAWSQTDDRALLLLRGPDNEYKQVLIRAARKTGLLGKRISFPEPVAESELIAAAQDGDVGLIPYTSTGKNYSNCCPNKTSQYMAARLPILANNTHFVRTLVEESGAGIVVDFSKTMSIVSAVAQLVANPSMREAMGKRGYSYFRESFNWEHLSKSMYLKLETLTATNHPCTFKLYEATKISKISPSATRTLYLQPAEKTPAYRTRIARRFFVLGRHIWRSLPVRVRHQIHPFIPKIIISLFNNH